MVTAVLRLDGNFALVALHHREPSIVSSSLIPADALRGQNAMVTKTAANEIAKRIGYAQRHINRGSETRYPDENITQSETSDTTTTGPLATMATRWCRRSCVHQFWRAGASVLVQSSVTIGPRPRRFLLLLHGSTIACFKIEADGPEPSDFWGVESSVEREVPFLKVHLQPDPPSPLRLPYNPNRWTTLRCNRRARLRKFHAVQFASHCSTIPFMLGRP